ncbi:hypothetical protein HDU99_010568, partial [Rhizoclosmatium hyalinum]
MVVPLLTSYALGESYMLQSSDMSVKVNITSAWDPNRYKQVFVVDKVVYTCGTQVTTFTHDSLKGSQSKYADTRLYCNSGSCNGSSGNVCYLVVIPVCEDPVDHVQVQAIQYMGTTATGGVCYKDDPTCP